MKANFAAFFRSFFALFGVHEVLFLAGFGGFFYGLSGLWSFFGALTVCGALLMLVSVGAIVFAQKSGS